jgi:hypothetical protein
MTTAEAPFPFTSMFQNGPRGFAPQNLFKPGKDFPPPCTNRAPLPAPGPREGKGGQCKAKTILSSWSAAASLRSASRTPSHADAARNPKIRSPPVDDVNNLRHDCKCQRRFASTAIQIRRNALFTSPEYALFPGSRKRIASGRWRSRR